MNDDERRRKCGQPAPAQCTHWHLHPLMHPIRCTLPAGHDGWHQVGSESWNDAAGEYAS